MVRVVEKLACFGLGQLDMLLVSKAAESALTWVNIYTLRVGRHTVSKYFLHRWRVIIALL